MIKDFYFVYFPIGHDFIKTMTRTFKYVPKEANIIVVTNYTDLLKDVEVDFNLTILDIDEIRDEWSKENEILIYDKDPITYRERLAEFQSKGIKFPYSIQRCIIPWLINRGVSKFAILDADCLLNYHGELESEFNSKIKDLAGNNFFGPCMDTTSYKEEFLRLSDSTLSKYNIEDSVIKNIPPLYWCFDGWLRGFYFNDIEDLQLFYNLWDEILKESYKQKHSLLSHNAHTFSDEWLHGLVMYIFTKIGKASIVYEQGLAKHIYHPENHFHKLPHGLYKDGYKLEETETREEFFKINRDKIIKFYAERNGIEENKIKEVIYDWS